MNTKLIIGIIIIVVAVGAVALFTVPDADVPETIVTEEEAMMKKEGEAMMEEGGEVMMEKKEDAMMSGKAGSGSAGESVVLAGTETKLYDFVKADYDAAFASDKLIVLYFYANWCPICKEEVASALYPAFNELADTNVIGFRVNYNDNETDASEKALAKEFGVAYQHTKVFVKNGERVLKSPESWEKSRYFDEIKTAQ